MSDDALLDWVDSMGKKHGWVTGGGGAAKPSRLDDSGQKQESGEDAKASAADLADRIVEKIRQKVSLSFDLAMLERLDMRTLLDVMEQLKRRGRLDDFADRIEGDHDRLGVAILTIQPERDTLWRKLLANLDQEDRAAVLERVPEDEKAAKGLGGSSAGPSKGGSGGGGHSGGSATVDAKGLKVQAKLVFDSKLTGPIRVPEFTLTLGPDGKLSKFELDLNLLKERFKKMGALAPFLELEGSLSLNAEAELHQSATKLIFGAVQAAVKGEIELKFKEIKALRRVSFKLSATAGSGGFGFTGTIEIAIPGL